MHRLFLHALIVTCSAVACVTAVGARSSTASAQTLSGALRVSSPFTLSLRAPVGLTLETESAASPRKQQRRAGWMMASGTGLIVGGVVHAFAFGRKGVCYEHDQRLATPAISGGLVTGLGLGLVIGGGIKLFKVPREYRSRHPASAGRRAGMIFTALGIATVTQAILFLPIVGEYIGCISS